MIYLSNLYRYDLCGILKLLPEQISSGIHKWQVKYKEREPNDIKEYEIGGFFYSNRSDYNDGFCANK